MLRPEIVDAVKDGKFHVWPIKTVEEGLEIITGEKAGVADDEGVFPEGTINAKVLAKVEELYKITKRQDDKSKNKENETEEDEDDK
jgi:predicted ATP-dependent protease